MTVIGFTRREAWALAWAISQKKRVTLKFQNGRWIVGGFHA